MKKRLLMVLFFVFATLGGIFSLTSCRKVEEILTKAPENVVYDGTYVTWDKTNGAEYYNVSIDGGLETRVQSTTFAHETTGSFEVTVTAVFKNSEKSTSITFKPLTTIQTVYVSDNGQISWDSVGGANGYILSVNGGQKTIADTRYAQLPEGDNRVKVKPIVQGDNSYYSLWSGETSVYIYSAPTSIRYEDGMLSWLGNAQDYDVSVGGAGAQRVTGNALQIGEKTRDFTVEIKSVGDHSTTYDSESVTEEFKYLAEIPELFVVDGIVKWNPIPNAQGYKIKIGGLDVATVTNEEFAGLTIGVDQEVKVMPYNNDDNYYSFWSPVKRINLLPSPEARWDGSVGLKGQAGKSFIWDAVSGAEGYVVRLTKDGKLVWEGEVATENETGYANAYAEIGKYTVEVKAKGNGSTYFDSRYTAPITIERLPAPKAPTEDFITSDPDRLSAGFTVRFSHVNNAAGYALYRGVDDDHAIMTTSSGTSFVNNNVANEEQSTEAKINYFIHCLGEEKTVDGQKYITLETLRKDALLVPITVQATPQNVKMVDFDLCWDKVNSGSDYSVKYAGTVKSVGTERLNLAEELYEDTYQISVCTRGNGAEVLASSYSTVVEVTRLAAPLASSIYFTDEQGGTLDFQTVAKAKVYDIYLDGRKYTNNENSYNNMYPQISEKGTTLHIVSIANFYEGQTYYMTSRPSATREFLRLSKPTFPKEIQSSTQLRWNPSNNVQTNVFSPTYDVYSHYTESSSTKIGGGTQAAPVFDIDYLEGGKSHTFYVRAIGNGSKFLSSEVSEVKVLWKIATPELKVENGKYVWNAVANASAYYLEIDGAKVNDDPHVFGTRYEYEPTFTTASDHIVRLRALGDGVNNLDSKFYTHIQKTEILGIPNDFTVAYSHSTVVENGKIEVTLNKAIENAKKYDYEIAGETISATGITCSKPMKNVGSFKVKVKAIGGLGDDGMYYVNSPFSEEKGITLLATPEINSITTDGLIQWKGITYAVGYEYQIAFDDGEFSAISNNGMSTSVEVQNYTDYRTISVRVRAKGDAVGATITSQWAEWTWTNPN